ncbi:MAG: hypothetical protein ACQXXL_08260 [Candidatus Methanosuratincola sp.]|jgi:hypothetical protein|nr:hypothetical protein [Candidatus Methanosuratincola sp.]
MKNPRAALILVAVAILAASIAGAVFLLGQPNNDGNGGGSGNQTLSVVGFPVDAGLHNGKDVMWIRTPDQKVSIRFTARISGTASSLAFYAFAYEGQPTVRVGIQGDSEGLPDGEWINDNSVLVQLNQITGFRAVDLASGVQIQSGEEYHIVVEAAEDPLNGSAGVFVYYANGFGQPFNPINPDIIWNDTAMSVLAHSGQSWVEKNKWPIFVIKYTNGAMEGQPYSLAAPWVVWGDTYVGQTFVPTKDYKITKIAFDVSTKQAAPQDKLYYQIRGPNNQILANGVFAEPGQLTAWQCWVEVELPSPVALKAGETYRIVLLSPGSSLENAYLLYGHEFCYNSSIGYGGHRHAITSSFDGGERWADNYDADAIFRLTVSN